MIKIDFKKGNGLVPVIVQDFHSNIILMLAYMDEEAWNKTIETGKAYYYSRSRNKLWMKGEQSGNVQEVKEIYIDCDNDSILLKVNQVGIAACHTGYLSCFYRDNKGNIVYEKIFDPKQKYDKDK